MLTYLRQGNRLLQPLNCPDELFRLMESCWSWDWEERPKISKLLSYLIDFNKTLGAYI
ncbi:tyrosine-protein kinase RYK-like [Convolutriloba macropyga]|uniref:tyrosine-protein kinase RYK-like n=1 Tax=Convolutriloba macropyga TaxID=536237 RepID=UPI003F524C24